MGSNSLYSVCESHCKADTGCFHFECLLHLTLFSRLPTSLTARQAHRSMSTWNLSFSIIHRNQSALWPCVFHPIWIVTISAYCALCVVVKARSHAVCKCHASHHPFQGPAQKDTMHNLDCAVQWSNLSTDGRR